MRCGSDLNEVGRTARKALFIGGKVFTSPESAVNGQRSDLSAGLGEAHGHVPPSRRSFGS